ncbi:hypothetical protein J7K27_11250 [Candidatus Bathyarchaeota archaeon]|nr:hypothetical protein [Candidatus Bathyarchaeota archaeon]
MAIPQGVLLDFLIVSGKLNVVKKEFKELKNVLVMEERKGFLVEREKKRWVFTKEKAEDILARIRLVDSAIRQLEKALKDFKKNHIERGFKERDLEFNRVLALGTESVEGEGDLRILFVYKDTWEHFQNLKKDFKRPDMTDDEMMRELFRMAGKEGVS